MKNLNLIAIAKSDYRWAASVTELTKGKEYKVIKITPTKYSYLNNVYIVDDNGRLVRVSSAEFDFRIED